MKNRRFLALGAGLAALLAARTAFGQQEALPKIRIELLTRAVSKIPLIIAQDQGFYKKHGLDVELWMPEPEYPNAIEITVERPEKPDLSIDGGTPMINNMTTDARYPKRVILASTDCSVRWHIIGRKGLTRLEDLKGKRLGISNPRAMTSFVARLLAKRMGWHHEQDISIMSNAQTTAALDEGLVDAFVADERYYATAVQKGYPVLADTSEWNTSIAGNSIRAEASWLKDPAKREIAKRFLMATLEGMAVYHKNREQTLEIMQRWHGVPREVASLLYEEGKAMPRKMYPCYDGIKNTMELFDSNEMRKHKPTDFYDDSLIKELDASGFIDRLYQ
ncbi:MAG TPA: ABC transporter substrate-binding protein [Terriglobia bacterium]|nr:ABC transporter substrate-binding protein [Terriglobia bacterium]